MLNGLVQRLSVSVRRWRRRSNAKPATPAVTGIASTREFAQMFQVVEVAQADCLVGEMFRRRYQIDTFPEQPRHFVGFYRALDGSVLPLGYVHHTLWGKHSLCGGLVIDDRLYRAVPTSDRAVIREAGGIAEAMLRESFRQLPSDVLAIWARVGHKLSERVCLRVGYRHTSEPYLMVIWTNPQLGEKEKQQAITEVAAYGEF